MKTSFKNSFINCINKLDIMKKLLAFLFLQFYFGLSAKIIDLNTDIKRKVVEIGFDNETWRPPAPGTPSKLTRVYLIPNAKMTKNQALDKIKELKEYLKMGIITQEDFDMKAAELKKILLGN